MLRQFIAKNCGRLKYTLNREIRRSQHTQLKNESTLSIRDFAKDKFKVGSSISGFEVIAVQDVTEFQLTAIRLRHTGTGADYLHIARDDSNNVFCVGFRTTPMDSTGVPHILEHTVLCGSEKFPCRDPFFKMLNRSLSTFMNAMTGNDYTMYPFSTQHPIDFRNLMSVYLDSVFKPNLTELDFLQEGWRLEHADPSDKNSPIEFKGVVFNEMKGVFANSQNLFMQKLQNGVLPSHTYGVVSGGDPLTIPELTWEHLRNFHANYYHPSNSRFYTYGDQPLENHLQFIEENYLQKFSSLSMNTHVPDETSWSAVRKDHINCSPDPLASPDAQTSLAVSFKLSNISNLQESFVLQIVCDLLFSGPNSHFYKSLIETQYGSSFSPASGFDNHTRDTTFTIGLQGMKTEDLGKVESIIDETFQKAAIEGIEQERIDATLHTIELALKHQSSSFGLGLIMSLYPLWNQDGDPIKALEVNTSINTFRQSLKNNPDFLKQKIKEYFIDNKHKYILTMTPEEDFDSKEKQKENIKLENKVNTLTEEDKEKIWHMGIKLADKQNEDDDISCLPTLKVSDIIRQVTPTVLSNLNLQSVPLQISEQPTNGVIYFNAILNTKHVPEDLKKYIPLFTYMLTKMGAGELDYRQLDQKGDLKTGGLYTSTHLAYHPSDAKMFEQGIQLSSHCLSKNYNDMMKLWESIINEVHFNDLDRFSTLIKMSATSKGNSLIHNGHGYAMMASSSTLSEVDALKEQWSGITYIQELKALSELDDLSDILSKLKDLSKVLLNKESLRVSLNTSPEDTNSVLKETENFLKKINGKPSNTSIFNISKHTGQCNYIHHVLPFPINYASKGFLCTPYTHSNTGPLRLLSRLMFKFLHREIREKGGAYGGGATMNPGGPFTFYSYRDPNSTQTLQTFDAAIDWILESQFTEQDISEAKLGIFQKLDSPVAPGSKGLRNFLSHITDEMVNEHRCNILDCDADTLKNVANIYLKNSTIKGASLIGPANEIISQDKLWHSVQH